MDDIGEDLILAGNFLLFEPVHSYTIEMIAVGSSRGGLIAIEETNVMLLSIEGGLGDWIFLSS